jgi:hypothetical protein
MQPAPGPAKAENRWALLRRLGFRFVFVYVALFLLIDVVQMLLSFETSYGGFAPGGEKLLHGMDAVWSPVVQWFATHVVRFTLSPGDTGGDSPLAVVEILLFLAVAAVARLARVDESKFLLRRSRFHWFASN